VRNSPYLIIGLLLSLSGPVRAQEPPPVRTVPQGLLIDFQDADLRLVLAALAEAGHLNLIYSELPSRRVTLRTNQPVPPDQIMPLLRSLASSNGLKITEDGAFIRVDDTGEGVRGQRRAQPTDTTAEPEVRLFVYRLKHARAVRLATTLQTIFGGVTGSRQALPASRTLSQQLRDQQVAPTEGQQAPAVSVELGPTPSGTPSLPGRLHGDIQIVADEATNSLLIRAQPDDWDVLKQSIETLDLRPLQVLIEVLIAEVRHTKEFQLGVSGRVGPRAPGDSSAVGNLTAGTLGAASAGDFVLRVMRVGRVDMDVALSALSSTGRIRIVSRPVLLAQNNQEARILIGTERPFVQVFRSLPTNEAVRDQVVQYKDVGTQLTLTPTINDDGYVNLQVSQQVSTATTEVQFGAPVISTREAATHLFVRDGQTAVIGGLVDREENRTRAGIPILKDIPLLGFLFGSTQRSDIQSELFLFVTPHIIASDADAERVNNGIREGTELLRTVLPSRDTVP